MHEIALFVEDFAHRAFLEALIGHLASEQDIEVELDWRNVRRGHGAVIGELRQYLRDLARDRDKLPEAVIIATDANCMGLNQRTKEITAVTRIMPMEVICAVPDPHIERWLLLDAAAFKQVFERGCDAPDRKCERARYKKMLIDNIRKAGVFPSIGGIEFTSDLVAAMDFDSVARSDPSFDRLLSELRALFQVWQQQSGSG